MNAIFEPVLYTPMTAVFIVVFYCLLQMGQPFISSRFFALRDVGSFKRVVLYVIVFTTIISSVIWGGIAARILFPGLKDADLAIPTLIQNVFDPVLAAVAVLGILAAMMTTIDALLITVGTAVGYDLYKKAFNPEATDKQIFRITQGATLVSGGIALVLALYKTPPFLSMLVFMALAGLASAVVGPVLVGVFDAKATRQGAVLSSIIGVLIFVVMMLGKYNVWISGSTAMISGILIALIASRVVGKPPEDVVERLFSHE
jgi:Na+/proline symporter